MIRSMDNTAQDTAPAQLNNLTLSPRGVLIARVPTHTEVSVMDEIRRYLKDCLPNNRVVVLWDSVDLSVIEDESYNERMCSTNDTTNYY